MTLCVPVISLHLRKASFGKSRAYRGVSVLQVVGGILRRDGPVTGVVDGVVGAVDSVADPVVSAVEGALDPVR